MNFSSITERLRIAATTVWSSWSLAYAGANDTGTRTSTVAMPVDSRREVSYRTRIELVKKSRWLTNNLGVYRRFISGTSRYAVGCGIGAVPETEDDDFNKLADVYFDDWASNPVSCDVRGLVSFYKLQKSVCHSMIRDGDGFTIKVGNGTVTLPSGRSVPGRPQLQWLESNFVANLAGQFSLYGIDDEGFRDGIRSNPFGKVSAYRVLQDSAPNVFDLRSSLIIPADAMAHTFNAERATSNRGLPWAYHGMNSALDIIDAVSLEKAAWKLHSTLAGAIKKKSADAGKSGFTGALKKTTTVNEEGKPKVIAYENFAEGAAILQLGLDEEFDLYSSQRPQTQFAEFVNFLIRDMAWGFGVSPEFIWSVSGLTGPNSRLILEDANWFFEEVQDLIVDTLCRPIYAWVISRAIIRGDLPECKDPNWWRCHWQGPAKITIDEGRVGQLELAQLDAGMATAEDFWGKRGHSGRKQMMKRVEEVKEAMDYCKEQGVPYEFYRTQKPGTPGANSGNNPGGTNGGSQTNDTSGSY